MSPMKVVANIHVPLPCVITAILLIASLNGRSICVSPSYSFARAKTLNSNARSQ